MKYTLIANSGLQFVTTTMSINTGEPYQLEDGTLMYYTFIEAFNKGSMTTEVDICTSIYNKEKKVSVAVPIGDLRKENLLAKSNGKYLLDCFGVPQMASNCNLNSKIRSYAAGSNRQTNINKASEVFAIGSLDDFRYMKKDGEEGGFKDLLGRWLPMPMHEIGSGGQSTGEPDGWCRLRIDKVGNVVHGKQKFRLTWAFDTKLAQNRDESKLRPVFYPGSDNNTNSKTYSLCNRVDLLFGDFLNIKSGNAVFDYLKELLQIDFPAKGLKYEFVGFYIYLINYIRLIGAAPQVELFNSDVANAIPVDMSLDIGNSRTCAVLFQNGRFTEAKMLKLTDMSEPWRSVDNPMDYNEAFDMRLAFRRVDFGGDLAQDKSLFQYPSLVRVGREAKRLVYNSLQKDGFKNKKSTNYSSPKRYLWDEKEYPYQWSNLVLNDDSQYLKNAEQIHIKGFTSWFDDSGCLLPKENGSLDPNTLCHYSRSSLMTFVMIEIMQQAVAFINSEEFRGSEGFGATDCRRCLRNIIITCPTAMPVKEQVVLRQAAVDAATLLKHIYPDMPDIEVTPDPDKIQPSNNIGLNKRGWLYDEAFANQFVYLYNEIVNKYGGDVGAFFAKKGHSRTEEKLVKHGFTGNAVTIGTIDIGAGTTDVMIAAYAHTEGGPVTPIPLYYDSFNIAGDDIMKQIVEEVVLEGVNDSGDKNQGSIANALSLHIKEMSPDEILKIKRINEDTTGIYRPLTDRLKTTDDVSVIQDLKHRICLNLVQDFFGVNASIVNEKYRRCRLDFNTQVSVPIAQKFLELLANKQSDRTLSYGDIFPEDKPAKYLLDHFEDNFGFRFEDLKWRYDSDKVSALVEKAMETLMKALNLALYARHCDALVFSGRPTNLKPLTDMLDKYIPVELSNNVVLFDNYRVGKWYPLADSQGYFIKNQKSTVAVGAQVGYLASNGECEGLILDFSKLTQDMPSTAKYIGLYQKQPPEIKEPFLTPDKSSDTISVAIPKNGIVIGCKQFDSPKYPARPLYLLTKSEDIQDNLLRVNLRRSPNDMETVTITNVSGTFGRMDTSEVELMLQTLCDGNFWMDEGAFTLNIAPR